ncbi:MAG: transcriptional repressor [Lachnospiraceae bacterium]|nr:transcriptional repressor [Lachnospiraceae bacterium]
MMQRELVIQKLRERGCRITRQRLMLLDIILQEDCSSCKEIYYKAAASDSGIGPATVYRMINTLEEIGAIDRKNMYKIACSASCEKENICNIEFDDNSNRCLSAQELYAVIQAGLVVCGYRETQNIRSVSVRECNCGR